MVKPLHSIALVVSYAYLALCSVFGRPRRGGGVILYCSPFVCVRVYRYTRGEGYFISVTPLDVSRFSNHFIIGRELMQELGLDMLYSTKIFRWVNIEVPMVKRVYWQKDSMQEFKKKDEVKENDLEETKLAQSRATEKFNALSGMLAAKYKAINVKEVVDKQEHLTIPERVGLMKVLEKRIKNFKASAVIGKDLLLVWS